MAKIYEYCGSIKNNWKKTVLGVAVVSYGLQYIRDSIGTHRLMRKCCNAISQYGDMPCPTNKRPRHVTVILNPNANKGKAKKLFTKYCEPLLHLSGIGITVINTTSENEARKIVMDLDTPTDAIIVAAGDGTLSDVLTGLVRKFDSNVNAVKQCPIGILPLGYDSKVAKSMYHKYLDSTDVRQIMEATMAIISEKFRMMHLIKVEPINENSEEPVKPIYAMGGLEWGSWKDCHYWAKKYWYFGPLRHFATYIFNYQVTSTWHCDATINYTNPCNGCSNCCQKDILLNESTNIDKRWWHTFIPRAKVTTSEIDYSKVIDEQCGVYHKYDLRSAEIHIENSSLKELESASSIPSLKLEIGNTVPRPGSGYYSFVLSGWKQELGDRSNFKHLLEAKDIEIIPKKETNTKEKYYIDNEEYDIKPIRMTIIPRAVKVFYPEQNS